MYVAKQVQRKGGRVYVYYALRETYWDPEKKTLRQRYLAGLGPSRRIRPKRAQEICKKLKISLEELRAVKGLRIAE